MTVNELGLTKEELQILKKLNTPIKIQDFLDTFPFNHEEDGETYRSPRYALKSGRLHCLEGALIAGLALWLAGREPLLMDLKAPGDQDHVVTLYQYNGYWGAISKTNHAVLRFRDPVYKTLRELALSYFHEYFDNKTGKKMLVSYSKPLNLKKLKINWITSEKDLDELAQLIDNLPHYRLYPPQNRQFIRPADKMERQAGEFIEWEKIE